MSPKQNRSEELLRRWISGAITAPEEAELERLATGDDGLRDAFDALRNLPEADHSARIDAMVARVQPIAVHRRNLFPRYAAAAAILLLLGVATLLLPHYYTTEEEAAIAMESAPVAKEPGLSPISTAPAPRRPAAQTRQEVENIPIAPPPTAQLATPNAKEMGTTESEPQVYSSDLERMALAKDDTVRLEMRPRPTEGYPALHKRIETDRPAGLSTGEVRVDFLVNPDGSLSDIRFPDEPADETVAYVLESLVESTWETVDRSGPVRVYLTLRFE